MWNIYITNLRHFLQQYSTFPSEKKDCYRNLSGIPKVLSCLYQAPTNLEEDQLRLIRRWNAPSIYSQYWRTAEGWGLVLKTNEGYHQLTDQGVEWTNRLLQNRTLDYLYDVKFQQLPQQFKDYIFSQLNPFHISPHYIQIEIYRLLYFFILNDGEIDLNNMQDNVSFRGQRPLLQYWDEELWVNANGVSITYFELNFSRIKWGLKYLQDLELVQKEQSSRVFRLTEKTRIFCETFFRPVYWQPPCSNNLDLNIQEQQGILENIGDENIPNDGDVEDTAEQQANDPLCIPIVSENGHENVVTIFDHNSIYFSDPNSGKTQGIRRHLNGKFFDLSFQNPQNVVEWKKEILIQTISGQYQVGRILSAIATATVHPDTFFYVFADEIGTFSLNSIIGSNLKKIFKREQQVNRADLQTILDNIDNLFLDNAHSTISLSKFQELGHKIKESDTTKVTSFKEGVHEFHLWIPENLIFVFCANYEEPLMESLDSKIGWGSGSDRFTIKHFYAADSDVDFIMQSIPPTPDAMTRYKEVQAFNNKIIKAYRGIKFFDEYNMKSEMILPRILLPTFHPCTYLENELLNRENCKKVVVEKIQGLYFSEEEDQNRLENAIRSL